MAEVILLNISIFSNHSKPSTIYMSYHYTRQIAQAYGLTFSQACFCRLCYLMSSSLCALPQYIIMLLHMVLHTCHSAADNRSSISAVFQVGGIWVGCAKLSKSFIFSDFFNRLLTNPKSKSKSKSRLTTGFSLKSDFPTTQHTQTPASHPPPATRESFKEAR